MQILHPFVGNPAVPQRISELDDYRPKHRNIDGEVSSNEVGVVEKAVNLRPKLEPDTLPEGNHPGNRDVLEVASGPAVSIPRQCIVHGIKDRAVTAERRSAGNACTSAADPVGA
jgi:hypothetical protein